MVCIFEQFLTPEIWDSHRLRNKWALTWAPACLLTTSDGEKVANPKNLQKLHKKLRLAQKSLRKEYKAGWYGRELIKIDRYFPSSKGCSNCGYVVEKLPLNIREWVSPECGSHHDRDINASINILAAGGAVSVWVAVYRPEESKSRIYGCYEAESP